MWGGSSLEERGVSMETMGVPVGLGVSGSARVTGFRDAHGEVVVGRSSGELQGPDHRVGAVTGSNRRQDSAAPGAYGRSRGSETSGDPHDPLGA